MITDLSRIVSKNVHPFLSGLILAMALTLVSVAVYAAGGTHTVFPHLFYIPVVLGVLFYRFWGGAAAGILGGLLCGPWMPLDVATGVSQDSGNWLLRLAIFSAVGMLFGLFATGLSSQVQALESLNEDSIRAFVNVIDAKSPYTARHSDTVARYASEIARELGLGSQARDRVYWAALLHDIGKLRVPDQILNKPDSLDDKEWTIIKSHAEESVRILSGIRHFRQYFPAIRQHHERLDGSGYPDGISGEAITLEARILAVADAFEAMTSERPYRSALSIEQACHQLRCGAGSQFDPHVVAAFLRSQGLVADQQAPVRRSPIDLPRAYVRHLFRRVIS